MLLLEHFDLNGRIKLDDHKDNCYVNGKIYLLP